MTLFLPGKCTWNRAAVGWWTPVLAPFPPLRRVAAAKDRQRIPLIITQPSAVYHSTTPSQPAPSSAEVQALGRVQSWECRESCMNNAVGTWLLFRTSPSYFHHCAGEISWIWMFWLRVRSKVTWKQWTFEPGDSLNEHIIFTVLQSVISVIPPVISVFCVFCGSCVFPLTCGSPPHSTCTASIQFVCKSSL